MSVKAGDSQAVVVDIHGLSSEGAGVGRLPDGRAVFVHRTAPGEKARIRVTEEKKRWARGRLLEILEEAPERREAPCPHYDRCGGCTLEHLEYEAQLRWKGQIISDALQRIGGLDAPVPDVVPSPKRIRYRSRVTLTLKRIGDSRVVAGFHELERPGRILDLGGECLLLEPEIARVWDRLRASWGPGARALPAGRELRLTLRSLAEGVLLVVEGGKGRGDIEALVEQVEGLVAVWRVDEAGSRRVVGPEMLTEEFLGEGVEIRGAAFLQVNREAGEALQRRLLERIGDPAGLQIVEAYCGVGIVGRHLARKGARVTGIEMDAEAVRGARAGAPDGQTIVEGRVEERLAELLPADLVLLNPPRTGLHDDIPQILGKDPPPRVVYVSCDPATLARDLDRLSCSHELRGLEAFDLFPQTAHVEVVADLGRKASPTTSLEEG